MSDKPSTTPLRNVCGRASKRASPRAAGCRAATPIRANTMTRLIFTAALVALLSACSGMWGTSSAGANDSSRSRSMGAPGSTTTGGQYDSYLGGPN
jgi:hypothetical protein